MDPTAKELRGARTLVSTLEGYAQKQADKVFATIPYSSDVSGGFRDVTYQNITRAVDAAAFSLKEQHGVSTTFETLMYVGVNDLRYAVFFFASIKCGYKSLFLSPRNPTEHNVILLQRTECTKCYHSEEMATIVANLKHAYPQLQTYTFETWTSWLDRYQSPFPFSKSFQQAKLDPVVVLHSSGSTGPPKPITLNNLYFSITDIPLPPIPGRQIGGLRSFDFDAGGFFYGPFPAFHLSGFLCMCVYPVFAISAASVIGPPDKPPSASLVKELLDIKHVKLLYTPPSIVEQIAQLPGGLETLSRLDTLSFVGGPLAPSFGDVLSQTVNVCQFYGSTEAGGVPLLIPLKEDWQYMEFHPSVDVTMEPSVDGASELVYKPNPEALKYRGIAATFPELEVFRTKDLFMPHPTKPGLWRFYGRNDDIIVLSNSQKYNPVPAESHILGHPDISGVLIFGAGKPQCAALIESRDHDIPKNKLLDRLWPTIEESNEKAPKFGRLVKSKVAIVDQLVRAPKGSVVRSLSLETHKALADALYAENAHDDNENDDAPKLATYDLYQAVTTLVRQCSYRLSTLGGINDTDDFYVQGLDSIETTELAASIARGLKPQYQSNQLSWLDSQMVFQNPSIASLSSALHAGLVGYIPIDSPVNQAYAMSSMVAAYEGRVTVIPQPVHHSDEMSVAAKTILLTGSSGSLGSRVLACLLNDCSNLSKVYCIGRSFNSEKKVRDYLDSISSSGDPKAMLDKCEFLTGRLDLEDFGLKQEKFTSISQTVNLIIHMAWDVNFNKTLSSFEPVHVQGVLNLVRLCISSTQKPKLVFASSISSVDDLNVGHIPEELVSNAQAAKKIGYAQSKQVAERIVHYAAQQKGVLSTVLRIGQVAGPASAQSPQLPIWNTREWFPSLIITSKTIQKLPEWLPAIDWVPSDVCADAIKEISLRSSGQGVPNKPFEVYNIVNPHRVTWSSLVDKICARLGPDCQIVSFQEWVEAVEGLAERLDTSIRMVDAPAVNLRQFWRTLEPIAKMSAGGWAQPVVRTDKAVEVSGALRHLSPVGSEWMEHWLSQWSL